VWTTELVVRPRPLTPSFFAERSDTIDAAASAQIFEALRGARLLNETGYLLDDPRCAHKPRGLGLHPGARTPATATSRARCSARLQEGSELPAGRRPRSAVACWECAGAVCVCVVELGPEWRARRRRPRRQTGREWRRAIQAGVPAAAALSLRPDEGAVPELLNLAWARHETDADAAAQARARAGHKPPVSIGASVHDAPTGGSLGESWQAGRCGAGMGEVASRRMAPRAERSGALCGWVLAGARPGACTPTLTARRMCWHARAHGRLHPRRTPAGR